MSSIEGTGAEDAAADAADATEEAARPRKPLQAVVIVHGMGEQRPMDTLRGFVNAVWTTDTSLTDSFRQTSPAGQGPSENKSWIKPDAETQSYELRRITTPYDVNGRRTDFYELYWADITEGTTTKRLSGWARGLLWRWPSEVPADARKLYIAAWLVALVIMAPAAVSALKWFGQMDFFFPAWGWSVLGAAMAAFVTGFLVPYFGDVASYVQAVPDTIGKRKQVRERGLALLEGLMQDPRYDRIVLVAHSLGTIIAYDLLQILWAKYGPNFDNSRQEPDVLSALRAFAKYALPMDSAERAGVAMSAGELDEFRRLQWRTYTLLRDAPNGRKPWKISDFVTCGSPLTHAEFLVTRNAVGFLRSIDERLIATCPPVSEYKNRSILFGPKGNQHPHHATVFAATRWTNIYDKGDDLIVGDPISGSLRENFGPGIEEIRVRMKWALGRIFTHTQYWSVKAKGDEVLPSGKIGHGSHLHALRDAVDLRRRLDRESEAVAENLTHVT
jgi:hypothetical protein